MKTRLTLTRTAARWGRVTLMALLLLGVALPALAQSSAYTVQPGDNLSKIARKFGVTAQAIVEANKTAYPCLAKATPCALQAGWALALPDAANIPAASPKPSDNAGLARAVFDAANQARAQNGLAPFAWNDTIAGIAQWRSDDMAARGYIQHFDSVTGEALAVAPMHNIGIYGFCEILVWSPSATVSQIPQKYVNGWLASPAHRSCLLGGDTQAGVGIAKGKATLIAASP